MGSGTLRCPSLAQRQFSTSVYSPVSRALKRRISVCANQNNMYAHCLSAGPGVKEPHKAVPGSIRQ
jgi:hypothetical protein